MDFVVIAVIINNAIFGIITSFFLKHLDSIVKLHASAAQLIVTALLSYPILGIAISWTTIISVLIITIALIIYAKNPLKEDKKIDIEDSKMDTDEQTIT